MNEMKEMEVDVRPILAKGVEPFPEIMKAKAALHPGQAMKVLAPFEPTPLYAHFEAEGYRVKPRRLGADAWEIHFIPDGGDAGAGDKMELDLRETPPPGPLQQGLDAVSRLGRGMTLVLHTRFRPVHFLEELEGEDFEYECEEVGPGHWTTHVWRVSAS